MENADATNAVGAGADRPKLERLPPITPASYLETFDPSRYYGPYPLPVPFQCPCCNSIPLVPLTAPCRHVHFCYACWNKSKNETGGILCPRCNQNVGEPRQGAMSPEEQERFNSLVVSCVNDKRGCAEMLVMWQLDKHVQEDCRKQETSCAWASRGCRWIGSRENLPRHKETCLRRDLRCDWCDGSFAPNLLNEHKTTCTGPCQLCNEPISLNPANKTHHEQNDCPAVFIPCPYPGCDNKTPCGNLVAHITAQATRHLLLVHTELERLKNRENELTNEITSLQRSIQADQREGETLTKRLREVEGKFENLAKGGAGLDLMRTALFRETVMGLYGRAVCENGVVVAVEGIEDGSWWDVDSVRTITTKTHCVPSGHSFNLELKFWTVDPLGNRYLHLSIIPTLRPLSAAAQNWNEPIIISVALLSFDNNVEFSLLSRALRAKTPTENFPADAPVWPMFVHHAHLSAVGANPSPCVRHNQIFLFVSVRKAGGCDTNSLDHRFMSEEAIMRQAEAGVLMQRMQGQQMAFASFDIQRR